MHDIFDKISIAPMMGITHYWGRRFLRLFNDRVMIYGEMVPARSLCFMTDKRKKAQFLLTDKREGRVGFQIGASEVGEAIEACRLVVESGFTAINLNCGCPAKAVKAGDFGAVLMQQPKKTASIMKKLSEEFPAITWSVKCRIGVDKREDDDFLDEFIATIIDSAPLVKDFHIHARKAILSGINPKANRTIPPLHYDRVYRLKEKFPSLNIIINGGIKTIGEAENHLVHTDGVMIGRALVANPFLLLADDIPKQEFYQKKLLPFLQEFDASDVPTSAMLPFLMAMIRDDYGAKKRRTDLANRVMQAKKKGQKLSLATALSMVLEQHNDLAA